MCHKFQANKCMLGAACPLFHPLKACYDELRQPDSCPRGVHCTFSHNPVALHLHRTSHSSPPPPGPATPSVSDSDASGSAASAGNKDVCRDFQKGSCPRAGNCKLYHPPPTKLCLFELQMKGSCKNGLECRFSHQQPGINGHASSRPNLKDVDVTHQLKGNNLFWMKAANKAALVRRLNRGVAKSLVTLDELSGKANAMGVELICGHYKAKKTRAPASKNNYAEPNSVRLKGPMEKVKDIKDILEEQEAILEKLPKHEARWLFSDSPWAKGLMANSFHAIGEILDKGANNAYGWYELIRDRKTDRSRASNKSGRSDKASRQHSADPIQLFSLALAKINGVELQVAYTPNLVAAQADAIIIR